MASNAPTNFALIGVSLHVLFIAKSKIMSAAFLFVATFFNSFIKSDHIEKNLIRKFPYKEKRNAMSENHQMKRVRIKVR